MKVSVLLLTFNEEQNLPPCLSALSWCDDIVVIDSGSTDATVEIAENAGARVLKRPFDDFASQRNHGLEYGGFQNEWVLHLDADEVITPEFRRALELLAPAQDIDAYRVPSKTMLHDRWLRHAGMYPTYQVRLGHRDRLRFKQVGHGQREDLPPCRVSTFDEPYLHYNFSNGVAAWFIKHLRYAADEAELLSSTRLKNDGVDGLFSSEATQRRRALKQLSRHIPLPLRPLARFFYVYFWRRGFLDGPHGALYALMLAAYETMIAVFVYDSWLRRR